MNWQDQKKKICLGNNGVNGKKKATFQVFEGKENVRS